MSGLNAPIFVWLCGRELRRTEKRAEGQNWGFPTYDWRGPQTRRLPLVARQTQSSRQILTMPSVSTTSSVFSESGRFRKPTFPRLLGHYAPSAAITRRRTEAAGVRRRTHYMAFPMPYFRRRAAGCFRFGIESRNGNAGTGRFGRSLARHRRRPDRKGRFRLKTQRRGQKRAHRISPEQNLRYRSFRRIPCFLRLRLYAGMAKPER